uniref:mRNA splicing factor snRNP-F n=1 Tax=Amorphochlora amoebiformis TaxID=1561963 RepID=A0A0H5BIT6_9EUKA|nr:mRNA splicing factor snRNP-F [Amorphochlora amoebiformis]
MKKYCNPLPLLKDLIGESLKVKLKIKTLFYKGNPNLLGYLVTIDKWINIQLTETDEVIKSKISVPLGDIFIKCSSIFLIYSEERKV